MQEIHFKYCGNRGKRGNNAEITNSLTEKKNEKDHFRIRKSSTKFHIKNKENPFQNKEMEFQKGSF